ncbi:MAG: methyltransferase domain-containing protein [Armatimonadetes bacterium]|nr:methyltransferase domain-containing protein [Armatimonadota bacterium]
MTSNRYVLETGSRGARRLEILSRAMWPSSRDFLRRTGLAPGWRCLDVGCGIGAVSCKIASRTGHCLGIDLDEGFVRTARERARRRGISGAVFRPGRGQELELLGESFDLSYARYLLSHQADPLAVLRQMKAVTRPGGTVAVEDIDFPGHFRHPDCPAFDRYLELYESVVARRGGNARLGRQLLDLAREAGLETVRVHLVMAVHHDGLGKRVAEVTMEHIGEAVVATELASRQEVDRLVRELRRFRRDPRSQISIAPTFQVSGRVP